MYTLNLNIIYKFMNVYKFNYQAFINKTSRIICVTSLKLGFSRSTLISVLTSTITKLPESIVRLISLTSSAILLSVR